MVEVKFFTTLRLFLGAMSLQLPFENGNMLQLLTLLEQKTAKPFLDKLLNDKRELHKGTMILVNGKNIHHMAKLETAIGPSDVVSLFPPGGGG